MSGYSAEDLAALKANYAKGVAEISRGDERIKFRSLGEMERIISRVEASMSGTQRVGIHYPSFDKGF
jgi:hypothetical protein